MTDARAAAPLTIAEQGSFWVGVERVERPFGTVATGQMYVQFQIPSERRHPHALVMVHGGGGQGLDFIATPDGRPGWATDFLRRGHAVYVVDRMAHGRAPHHPDVQGPATPPPSYERMVELFSAPAKHAGYPQARLHTQWPGSGEVGDPALDQFMAGQGGMLASMAETHRAMRKGGAALLDRIGPAVLMTHSMGGAFGWLAADARPSLVKAIVALEPVGPPFMQMPGGMGGLDWGLTAIPMAYDPPAANAGELRRAPYPAPGPGLVDAVIQAEPARRLKNLAGIPILLVTSEASWMAQFQHATAAFLRQAGADVRHLRLEEAGIRGNGHLMMGEKNSAAIAALLDEWIAERTK
ncbi:MAG TPA: alpha/beta hydrolase [Hyphomicrobiales bacterium]|nr:alpha/beta hydrolase [Hyphomicrobiales bacterium]